MLFPLSLSGFGISLDEKCSWSSYGFFMNVLHCSWHFSQEQKVWCFDLFHKVFVLCFIKCFNVIEILKGDRNGDGCVRSTSLTHTSLAWLYVMHHLQELMSHLSCTTCKALWLKKKYSKFLWTPLPKPATPSMGVLLGLLCNYIKFWYFCVFALWPKSLRFYV